MFREVRNCLVCSARQGFGFGKAHGSECGTRATALFPSRAALLHFAIKASPANAWLITPINLRRGFLISEIANK